MKRFSSSLLLLALACLGPVEAAVPSPDKLLASDTLGVITVPDFAQARKRSGQWPMIQCWNDAAMKPFRDKLVGKIKTDLLGPLEKEMGIRWADYQGLAQGQVTLAFTQNGWEGKPDQTPGFLFLLDAREEGETRFCRSGSGIRKHLQDDDRNSRCPRAPWWTASFRRQP